MLLIVMSINGSVNSKISTWGHGMHAKCLFTLLKIKNYILKIVENVLVTNVTLVS